MLASVNISCAGFVRKDRKVTDQVNKDHAASSNAGKYDKNLFDPKETDGPQRVARAARTTHERLTLRWGKQSLLTVAMFDRYAEAMEQHKRDFEQSVADLIAKIPELKERARINLNGMYKESDYAFIETIEDRYAFKREITPVPSGDNFIADLVDSEIETIRSDIEEANKAMLDNAVQDSFSKLHTAVKHIADSLDGYTVERVRKAGGKWKNEPSRKLYDSMLGNLADLIDVLPALNITNDVQLDGLIADIKASDILKHDVETFKQPDNAALVKAVQSEANEIADKMAGFFGATNEVN
tara:strand:+ start:360 stop:1253 length:894 start_codon:yes stop_codon:yes gene_type:complete